MSVYLNADCMDEKVGLPSYPDNHFDLAIVDPPYGIGRDGGETGKNWKRYKKKNWDSQVPSVAYFRDLFRVSKDQIIWGANYFTEFLPASMGWIFWDKGQELTMSDGELAFSSFQKALRRIIINRCHIGAGAELLHPTQKPIALYRWLLTNYAKPGMRLLDTHVGSASSLVAFEEMGFEYVGFELDADYYRDSVKRLEAYRSQPKLFSGAEIFEASKPPTLF